jgi:hypothetical protein
MSETFGEPRATRVVAEGYDDVIKRLEGLGVPDYGLGACLDVPDDTEWFYGCTMDEGGQVPDGEMWTVTLRGGIYRIEAGSADLYFDYADGYDEEEEEEEEEEEAIPPAPAPPALVPVLRPPVAPAAVPRRRSADARRKARRKAERQARRKKR